MYRKLKLSMNRLSHVQGRWLVILLGLAFFYSNLVGKVALASDRLALPAPNVSTSKKVAAWPPFLGPQNDVCDWERELDALLEDGGGSLPQAAERPKCEERLARFGTVWGVTTPVAEEAAPGLRLQVAALVSDSPMEAMTAAIARFDPEIAGLIVGIGKKESDWGRHTPKLAGEECFNFWGYRGPGDRGLTPDGYGCWVSPEAAVQTIGNRLSELRTLRASSAPERMVVWKCGSSCAAHSPESVRKWIADVDLYYREIARR